MIRWRLDNIERECIAEDCQRRASVELIYVTVPPQMDICHGLFCLICGSREVGKRSKASEVNVGQGPPESAIGAGNPPARA